MGERSQASIDLQTLSDAALREKAKRGDEAAHALVLSRSLTHLSMVLSGHDREESYFASRLSPESVRELGVRLAIVDALIAELMGGLPAEDSGSSSSTQLKLLHHNGEVTLTGPQITEADEQAITERSWREFLGPLLSRKEARRRLGLASRRELDSLVEEGKVIALPVNEGKIAFPEFQFRADRTVYPTIASIVRIFRDAVTTPYTIASWLKGPKDYLEGYSPIRWLELERDPQPVIAGAERAAAQLNQ